MDFWSTCTALVPCCLSENAIKFLYIKQTLSGDISKYLGQSPARCYSFSDVSLFGLQKRGWLRDSVQLRSHEECDPLSLSSGRHTKRTVGWLARFVVTLDHPGVFLISCVLLQDAAMPHFIRRFQAHPFRYRFVYRIFRYLFFVLVLTVSDNWRLPVLGSWNSTTRMIIWTN